MNWTGSDVVLLGDSDGLIWFEVSLESLIAGCGY